mgnify:FL=1
MNRQNLLLRLITTIKLIILFLMIAWFGMDCSIVHPASSTIFYTYELTMFTSVIFFFATFFSKTRKLAYVLFIISFIVYLAMYNFSDEIIIQHKIDVCLDQGLVWDGNELRCRKDCWRWSVDKGCEKSRI